MNLSKLSTIAAAVAMGTQKVIPKVIPKVKSSTSSGRTIKVKSRRLSRQDWQRRAGQNSKRHQFPDTEILPDGRHAWYKKNGSLKRRDEAILYK